jgi:hypothetical protein
MPLHQIRHPFETFARRRRFLQRCRAICVLRCLGFPLKNRNALPADTKHLKKLVQKSLAIAPSQNRGSATHKQTSSHFTPF